MSRRRQVFHTERRADQVAVSQRQVHAVRADGDERILEVLSGQRLLDHRIVEVESDIGPVDRHTVRRAQSAIDLQGNVGKADLGFVQLGATGLPDADPVPVTDRRDVLDAVEVDLAELAGRQAAVGDQLAGSPDSPPTRTVPFDGNLIATPGSRDSVVLLSGPSVP